MTVKKLRDFLNDLDLDSVQKDIIIVATTTHEGKPYISICDIAEVIISEGVSEEFKPYIQLITDDAEDLLDLPD